MGRRLGPSLVESVLDFAVNEFDPSRLRLLILDWNERSLKVAKALGFAEAGVVPSAEGAFRVLRRSAH
jgi:RimJ/RimL family protein N-acetyltransferase